MFKLIGISYTDFTTKDGDTIKGYRAFFQDENSLEDASKGIGSEVFSSWFTLERAARLGINSPDDMYGLREHIGKPVGLVFDRKGDNKIEGWDLVVRRSEVNNFPPDVAEKPKKLGA